ncbi:MAG: hypothetical protein NWE93_02270 [Candidatus Bathyarchaeota archaeon]|nr:hypothetical protein [Candidatus Bathyarchaeota archaeon]
MSQSTWKKPVICIFRERNVNPESDPFVVIMARQITLSAGENPKFAGAIDDFFTLMGDTDYLSSVEGKADHYVMCWFDNDEPDMSKDLRRLRGVRFTGDVVCSESPKTHKRTYNATFSAEQGKTK